MGLTANNVRYLTILSALIPSTTYALTGFAFNVHIKKTAMGDEHRGPVCARHLDREFRRHTESELHRAEATRPLFFQIVETHSVRTEECAKRSSLINF